MLEIRSMGSQTDSGLAGKILLRISIGKGLGLGLFSELVTKCYNPEYEFSSGVTKMVLEKNNLIDSQGNVVPNVQSAILEMYITRTEDVDE